MGFCKTNRDIEALSPAGHQGQWQCPAETGGWERQAGRANEMDTSSVSASARAWWHVRQAQSAPSGDYYATFKNGEDETKGGAHSMRPKPTIDDSGALCDSEPFRCGQY